MPDTRTAYDHHNRLTGIGSQANVYRYSPEGHRVEAHGVQYVIDPNAGLSRVLMRKDGSQITYYVWGAGLLYEIDGSDTKTYHPDHLGSTMVITDDTGAQTAAFEYDSYGNLTYSSGSVSTPFRWHGTFGVITEANGLIHMRARFYNPRIMRFLNQDPIGFQGGLNWFAFGNGNPLSSVDPSGFCGVVASSSMTTGLPNLLGADLNISWPSERPTNNVLQNAPNLGDKRYLNKSTAAIQGARMGANYGDYDRSKALVMEIVQGLNYSFTALNAAQNIGTLSSAAQKSIQETITVTAYLRGQQLGEKSSAGSIVGAAENIINQYGNLVSGKGPFQAFIITYTETYTEESLFGLGILKTRNWVPDPNPTITPLTKGDLPWGFSSEREAIKTASEVLQSRLSKPPTNNSQ